MTDPHQDSSQSIQQIVNAAVLREAQARVKSGEALVDGAWVQGHDRIRQRRRAARIRAGQRLELLLFWGGVALFGLVLVALVGLIA